MAARFPLIANSSANQIQELASGDDMDLTGSSITGAGIITATSFSGSGANLTGIAVTAYVDAINITASGITTTNGLLDANAEVTAAGGIDIAGGLKVGAAITASSTLTVAGNVDIADTLYHTGDTNTALRFPSADTITAETSGSERVRVDSSGNVGVNSTSPRAKFDVRGSVTVGGGQLAEKFATSGTALNSATSIDLDEGMVHYRSANLGAASVKPDIISSVGINTALKIGEALAVTIITAVNSTSNFVSSVAIDGRTTGISTYWTGGAIPTAGGGSNVDIYAFNILKTADNTFTVIANQTLTSS